MRPPWFTSDMEKLNVGVVRADVHASAASQASERANAVRRSNELITSAPLIGLNVRENGTSISREGGSLALILLRDSTNSTLIDVLWNRCPFVTVSSNRSESGSGVARLATSTDTTPAAGLLSSAKSAVRHFPRPSQHCQAYWRVVSRQGSVQAVSPVASRKQSSEEAKRSADSVSRRQMSGSREDDPSSVRGAAGSSLRSPPVMRATKDESPVSISIKPLPGIDPTPPARRRIVYAVEGSSTPCGTSIEGVSDTKTGEAGSPSLRITFQSKSCGFWSVSHFEKRTSAMKNMLRDTRNGFAPSTFTFGIVAATSSSRCAAGSLVTPRKSTTESCTSYTIPATRSDENRST
mmetsp:Transcript_39243/g.92695  ORF Transcript_39243/g.92695 Transcript_39243/m.92695 type:complete len:350 (-) Transcript_39243:440-1489(-)